MTRQPDDVGSLIARAKAGDAAALGMLLETFRPYLALLARLQSRGGRIAMIGDGINDAPVLAQADASIALASGSDLAQARADVICLRSSLADVGFVFELARRTKRAVRTNLTAQRANHQRGGLAA